MEGGGGLPEKQRFEVGVWVFSAVFVRCDMMDEWLAGLVIRSGKVR